MMTVDAHHQREYGERRFHAVALLAALLASALFHLLIWNFMPPLPYGRPPSLERRDARIPPVTMEKVLREYRGDTLQQPARFRPEDPQAKVPSPLSADAELFAQAVLPADAPATVSIESGPLAGEKRAVLDPSVEARPVEWDPRAEIMMIERRIYADKVSALPRRLIDQVPRSAQAPDIVLPTENFVSSRPGEGAGGESGAGEGRGPLDVAGLVAGAPRVSLAHQLALAEAARVRTAQGISATDATEALLKETTAAVAPVKALEHMLALDIQTYTPPDEPDLRYFSLRIRRVREEQLPVLPKDIIFLQDSSLSMGQTKIEEFRLGLRHWLRLLGPRDRFNIVAFGEYVLACFPESVAVNESNFAQADMFLSKLSARGRTDIYSSLQTLLKVPRQAGRPLLAVWLSDGRPTIGVSDSSQIIERFTRENRGGISFFSVGAGERVNRYLLDFIAYKNRGGAMVVPSGRSATTGALQMAQEINSPVLLDLTYRLTGDARVETYPRTLTHLYLDRPLMIYGRLPAATPDAAVRIVGTSPASDCDIVFPLRWREAERGDQTLRIQWAWQRLYELIGEHIQTGDPRLMDEIRDVARRYAIQVPYEHVRK